MTQYSKEIAQLLQLNTDSVVAALQLFSENATIPFVARYRKDKTGGLDEVQLANIKDTAKTLAEFYARKETIINSITEQEKMTSSLLEKINAAKTIAVLEDIYLPYKPKRKTKAQIARENGLEPLAIQLFLQKNMDVKNVAEKFINEKITTIEEAISGATDIITEWITENERTRAFVRKKFERKACLISKVMFEKEKEGIKYKDYFEYREPIGKVPSHRILAIMRAALEGYLRMSIEPVAEEVIADLESDYIKNNNETTVVIKKAVKDAYKRYLQPQFETEFRQLLKEKADKEAIAVFSDNLRQLLLSSPLGNKRILAIDPGIKTGGKVVCLDEKGDLLMHNVIFNMQSQSQKEEAGKLLRKWITQYNIEAIAIGDGTAGRETEQFVKSLQLAENIKIFLVNEDGASIYSASEVGREEFPAEDVTVRGAVSIGRRLMDPLAELVKIDPKSIGIGQYQHDVNPFLLKEKLDETVESCVNQVGVNLNTASKHLLAYVSGIGPSIAENIVKYREENGKFIDRNELKKVSRLGEKAFEQCAGFLRINEGKTILDKTGVHPESYTIVEDMAKDLAISLQELIGNESKIKEIKPTKYITENTGIHTIEDIIKELRKPGLDPRNEISDFQFAEVYKIEELYQGMILPGIVTNITKFGAFIDIGVKQDGLVHISELADKFVKDPLDIVKLNQKVTVKILDIDINRKRIMLSMRGV